MEKEFEREVLDRLIKIETKLDEQDYKGLKKQSEDADNRSINNEKRISSLETKVTVLENKPQKYKELLELPNDCFLCIMTTKTIC